MKIKFKAWFKAQFGDYPHMSDARRVLLLHRIKKADEADAELMRDAKLRDEWTTALYAWNAAKGESEKGDGGW